MKVAFNYRMVFNNKGKNKRYKGVFSKTTVRTAEMIHFSCNTSHHSLQKTKVAKEEDSKI